MVAIALALVAIVLSGVALGAQYYPTLIKPQTTGGTPQSCVGILEVRTAGPLIPPLFGPSPLIAHNDDSLGFVLTLPSTLEGSFSSTVPVSVYILNQTQNAEWQQLTSFPKFHLVAPTDFVFGVQSVTGYSLHIRLPADGYAVYFMNFGDSNGSVTLTTDWTACPPQPP